MTVATGDQVTLKGGESIIINNLNLLYHRRDASGFELTDSGMQYDEHNEAITVIITDNGAGEMSCDVQTDVDGISFTNQMSQWTMPESGGAGEIWSRWMFVTITALEWPIFYIP